MNFLQESIKNLHDLKHVIDIDADLVERTEAIIAATYTTNKYMNCMAFVETCLDQAIAAQDAERRQAEVLDHYQRQRNYDRLIEHNRRRANFNALHPEREPLAPLSFPDHMLRLAGLTDAVRRVRALATDNVVSLDRGRRHES